MDSELLSTNVAGVILLLVIEIIMFARQLKTWIWGTEEERQVKEILDLTKTLPVDPAEIFRKIGEIDDELVTVNQNLLALTGILRNDKRLDSVSAMVAYLHGEKIASKRRESDIERTGYRADFSAKDRKRIAKIYGNVKKLTRAAKLSETELS